jgi:hypothetical protein
MQRVSNNGGARGRSLVEAQAAIVSAGGAICAPLLFCLSAKLRVKLIRGGCISGMNISLERYIC